MNEDEHFELINKCLRYIDLHLECRQWADEYCQEWFIVDNSGRGVWSKSSAKSTTLLSANSLSKIIEIVSISQCFLIFTQNGCENYNKHEMHNPYYGCNTIESWMIKKDLIA